MPVDETMTPLTQAQTLGLTDAVLIARQARDISEWMRPTIWRIPAYIRWRRSQQPADVHDALLDTP